MRLIRLIVCTAIVLGASAATAATIKVNPGDSIQDAVDAAAAGDTIKVWPGTYVETHGNSAAVRVTKPLKLIAKSRKEPVIIEWDGVTLNQSGIVVEPETDPVDGIPTVSGVKIKGFTIKDFPEMGIWTRYVDKFKIQDNISQNNLENGIFPTLSTNGLVKKNVAYGAIDAALWVEASTNVRIIKNELYNSPTGLEVTISQDILAKKNIVHDNVVGIGLYHPDGASLDHTVPTVGSNGNWKFIKNEVYNNNFPNPATGGLVGSLPSGGGVLVIGVDNVEFKKNNIYDNDFFGFAVLDWCTGAMACGPGNTTTTGVDAFADNNAYVKNELSNNGNNPTPFGGLELLADNVTFIQAPGHLNCFAKNVCSDDGILPLADCSPTNGITGSPNYVIQNSC